MKALSALLPNVKLKLLVTVTTEIIIMTSCLLNATIRSHISIRKGFKPGYHHLNH